MLKTFRNLILLKREREKKDDFEIEDIILLFFSFTTIKHHGIMSLLSVDAIIACIWSNYEQDRAN